MVLVRMGGRQPVDIPRKVEILGREVEWQEVDFSQSPKQAEVIAEGFCLGGGFYPRAPMKLLKGLFIGPIHEN